MIKALSLEMVSQIYHNYLIHHFPENEVKPFKNIVRMWEEKGYFAYGYYEGADLVGYAFFVCEPGADIIMLDYYAILDDKRASGYGSKFLKALSEETKEKKGIIIETELVEKAANAEEKAERIRRNHFYERNGVIPNNWAAAVYGADYRLWTLPCREVISEEECKEAYDAVYKYLLSEKGYKNFFQIEYLPLESE